MEKKKKKKKKLVIVSSAKRRVDIRPRPTGNLSSFIHLCLFNIFVFF
nr:hypothetical protein C16E9.5 - Caenorhabditis elegans [Caenorhabditis elegans]